MTTDYVLGLLQAALTPTLAVIAAYIAYQQYRTARHRLRLDLYDRRFKVFEGLMDFLRAVLSKEHLSVEELYHQVVRLETHLPETAFLFGNDVRRYLGEVFEKARQLSVQRYQLNSPHTKELTRDEAFQDQETILDWLAKQPVEAERIFGPYLSFKWLR